MSFSPFQKGKTNAEDFDDTPQYLPGRFHAHQIPSSRPTSPIASTSTNKNNNNNNSESNSPFISFRDTARILSPSSNLNDSVREGAGLLIPRPRKGTSRRVIIVEEDQAGGNNNNNPERWGLLRPSPEVVERWLDSWIKRWFALVVLPCLFVWIWCALPFPVTIDTVSDPPSLFRIFKGAQIILDPELPLPVDANFYFFLIVYYGTYLAVALVFVTKLFDLYRLSWWPSRFGGSISYFFFWTLSLSIGFTLHYFNLDGFGSVKHKASESDWERKSIWVVLAFVTMAMPALVCFLKLRTDRRQSYRHSLTAAQKTFLDRQLVGRIPRSYKRFLWFLLALTLSLLALIIGQGFATIYLSTLPHSNIDGIVYVWTWILSVQCLNSVSNWVLQRKVRSKALVFIFRFYYFLVYYIFYRNLFARLRSPDQAIAIQLLSSSFVIFWYPVSMSKTFHKFLTFSIGFDQEYEEYAESVACMLYLRNLSENVTMVAFLGWITILHFGPNNQLYPFFSFESTSDPYTYRLTIIASLIIWGSELLSSFLARLVIWFCYKLDVTNIGLDEFREHPELVICAIVMSIHVLMDMLLFLIKLNFR